MATQERSRCPGCCWPEVCEDSIWAWDKCDKGFQMSDSQEKSFLSLNNDAFIKHGLNHLKIQEDRAENYEGKALLSF